MADNNDDIYMGEEGDDKTEIFEGEWNKLKELVKDWYAGVANFFGKGKDDKDE